MKFISLGRIVMAALLVTGCAASSNSADQTILENTGKSAAPSQLENVYWKLTMLDGTTVPALDAQREAHLVFTSPDAIIGSTGCNRLMGSYSRQGSKLHFEKIAATRRFCADTAELETAFLKMLDGVTAYEQQGNRLVFQSDEKELAEWQAQPDKDVQ